MCVCTIVPIVYPEFGSYQVLEEDGQVDIIIVREGNLSEVSTLLLTTFEGTALGNTVYIKWVEKTLCSL